MDRYNSYRIYNEAGRIVNLNFLEAWAEWIHRAFQVPSYSRSLQPSWRYFLSLF